MFIPDPDFLPIPDLQHCTVHFWPEPSSAFEPRDAAKADSKINKMFRLKRLKVKHDKRLMKLHTVVH
jgi:hypothetical protein